MNISDFKRISSALSKTIHAFSLCFDSSEVNDASLSYDGECFYMSFNCFVEDFGVSNLSSSSDGEDAGVVIKSFFSNLISEIDSNLSDLGKDEKNDEKNWKEWRVYSTEYSCLPRIASLKMLKDILLSFGE